MPIADKMVKMVEAASMIRKMFEEGIRMREKLYQYHCIILYHLLHLLG